MNFDSVTVKYSEIKQDALLADLYSKIYTIPKSERVKVLMSWLANAFSDLLIPFLQESETLEIFTVYVRLLDTFSNNSSYEIVAQLASEFSDNFLISQVTPNLLENHEKTSDITYYIQIICENLTCSSLIRKVMDVVTSKLNSVFVARITSDNPLIVSSTLSLIKTLLEFYCEDFWYDLILQYLLPMKHLLTSQRQKLLPEIEFYESTHKLLELIPAHVTQTTCPSLLAQHFLLYYQDEIMRLRVIDTAVATSVPSSQSDLQRVGLGISDEPRKPGKNQTYPMWIFRYDGTDFLHALRSKGFLYEEPEEFFEDDLFSATNQLDQSATTPTIIIADDDDDVENENKEDVLERSLTNYSEVFTESGEEISLRIVFNENSPSSLEVSGQMENNLQASIVQDKRKSMDSLEGCSSSIYFGPFLHRLFDVLQNWTAVDPAILFTATEVVSVLASSRIPLINVIFLDMSLTLQPSYPNFSNLVHSVKTDLDEHMKSYPDYIFRNVWKAAAKDCSLIDFYTKNGPITNGEEDDPDQSNFVDKLKRSIAKSRSLRMAAEEVQRTVGFGRRGSAFRNFTDLFKNSQTPDNKATEFRLLSRAASNFEREEEENAAKVMALRSILFTHWMLELGAIAMQLSWGRRPLNVRENHNYMDDEAATKNNNEDDDSPTFSTNSE